MENNNQWPPRNGGANSVDGKKIGRIILIAAISIFVIIGIVTCFYTVDDKQQAVDYCFPFLTLLLIHNAFDLFIASRLSGRFYSISFKSCSVVCRSWAQAQAVSMIRSTLVTRSFAPGTGST